MKSWRERIAEARESGAFTQEDIDAWACGRACLVGEQRRHYGLNFSLEMADQAALIGMIRRNEFAALEEALDAIEDSALKCKREGRLGSWDNAAYQSFCAAHPRHQSHVE